MTTQIPVLSNVLTAEELNQALQVHLPSTPSVTIELQEESPDDMALDPTVLVAIITGGATVLTSIITGLFAVWNEKRKAKTSQKTAEVRIRVDKTGTEVSFPYGMTVEEQQRLVETAVQLSEVRHIALVEKEEEK